MIIYEMAATVNLAAFFVFSVFFNPVIVTRHTLFTACFSCSRIHLFQVYIQRSPHSCSVL